MQAREFLNLTRDKFVRNLPKFPTYQPPVSTDFHYLEAESNLGSQLFGPVPEGVDRKFFHSTKKNVWIWHENGTTVRYEVRPNGIWKRVNENPFTKLSGLELTNFRLAAINYLNAVKSHLYKRQA